MPDCVCLPKCPFFNDRMAEMPALAKSMKKKYCQGDFAACARYMVFSRKGREAVPSDLFPNQTDRVAAILAAAA
jgi:hypothetical protein